MEYMLKTFGESVNLATRQQGNIVLISVLDSPNPVRKGSREIRILSFVGVPRGPLKFFFVVLGYLGCATFVFWLVAPRWGFASSPYSGSARTNSRARETRTS